MSAVQLISAIWSPRPGEYAGHTIPVMPAPGHARSANRSVRFSPASQFGIGVIFRPHIQYDTTHADAGIVGTREQVDAYLRRQEARCDS